MPSIAHTVGDGDDGAFYNAWTDAADRLMAEGDAAQERGRRASASEAFLKAACFYGTSYHPLFGEPLDPRLISGSRLQTDTFNRGLALHPEPVAPMRILFENCTLPYVDPDRIALSGWSLGSYLAPPAASVEHRLAACIAEWATERRRPICRWTRHPEIDLYRCGPDGRCIPCPFHRIVALAH